MLLLLFNCEKEKSIATEIEHIQQKPISIKTIFKDDITSNEKIVKHLEAIRKRKQMRLTLKGKTNSKTNIEINSDYATYLELADGYHSYTFPVINTPQGEGLQNVLLSLQADGSYKEYLTHYSLTEAEIEALRHGAFIDLQGKYTIQPLDTDFASDLFGKVIYQDACIIVDFVPYTCSSGLHEFGDSSCKYINDDDPNTHTARPGGTYTMESLNCTAGSTTSTTANPHSSGSNPKNNPISSPALPSYEDVMFNQFISKLSNELQIWINAFERITIRRQLFDYLKINDYSIEAEVFGKMAAKAKMDGGDVDFPNKVILDTTFTSNLQLKCVYDKFKNSTSTISGYLDSFLPDNSVAHLNVKADNNFANTFPNQTNTGAITDPPINGDNGSNVPGYNINIIFNTDPTLSSSAQNFPTIILAQELIHEMVHAEMYRKLLECAQLPHVNYDQMTDSEWRNFIYNLRNNFEGLYDYFMRYKYYEENGVVIAIQGPTQEQHQQMASHYRDMMVEALKDFDNNQHTDEFYNALAWIGLKGTVAWNDPSVNQTTINTIINNAIQNETHDCTN